MPDLKRLLVAGGVVVVLLFLFWRAAGSVAHSGPTPDALAGIPTDQNSLSPVPSPTLSSEESSSSRSSALQSRTRIYAVSLPELSGLPADAKAGTALELWVAWEPPVTRRPRIQRLATGVSLARIVLPVVPDGSPAALLRIPVKEMPSVLYGDRYGALSAVITGE
jgi:hypothetical protein